MNRLYVLGVVPKPTKGRLEFGLGKSTSKKKKKTFTETLMEHKEEHIFSLFPTCSCQVPNKFRPPIILRKLTLKCVIGFDKFVRISKDQWKW
jgi:hypothetical protein